MGYLDKPQAKPLMSGVYLDKPQCLQYMQFAKAAVFLVQKVRSKGILLSYEMQNPTKQLFGGYRSPFVFLTTVTNIELASERVLYNRTVF